MFCIKFGAGRGKTSKPPNTNIKLLGRSWKHSTQVGCATQQTRLLWHTADMSKDTGQEESLKNKWSHRIPYQHEGRTRTAFTTSWARPLWKTHEHKRDRNNMNERRDRRLDCLMDQISRQGCCNHVSGPSLYFIYCRLGIKVR